MAGQRPRRGMYPVRKERQEMRIQAVGLGELPCRFAKVADLARIRDHEGERRGGQGRDERGFVPAGRFKDDQARRHGTQTVDGSRDAFGIITRRPRRPVWTAGHHKIGLGDVDADEGTGRCHRALPVHDPSWPGLADAGSRPLATVRAHDETLTTPTLSCGLMDRRKQRAVVSGWPGDCTNHLVQDTRKH